MASSELIQLMESRANMYNLLARAFISEVDQDFLKELKHMRFPQNTGNDDVDAAYLALYKYLRKTPESVLDDLAVDYARTFIGSGALDARAAYPFESVYTSEKGLLMQAARDEVLAILRAEQLAEMFAWNEGEDHVSIEFLFMREMAKRTKSALEADDEDSAFSMLVTQRNFQHDHLLNWVFKWAEDVPKYTKLPFYTAFANLACAYLREDEALLIELVGEDETLADEESPESGQEA